MYLTISQYGGISSTLSFISRRSGRVGRIYRWDAVRLRSGEVMALVTGSNAGDCRTGKEATERCL
jgi:hypothetical protein